MSDFELLEAQAPWWSPIAGVAQVALLLLACWVLCHPRLTAAWTREVLHDVLGRVRSTAGPGKGAAARTDRTPTPGLSVPRPRSTTPEQVDYRWLLEDAGQQLVTDFTRDLRTSRR